MSRAQTRLAWWVCLVVFCFLAGGYLAMLGVL